jgi:hypothetical protein
MSFVHRREHNRKITEIRPHHLLDSDDFRLRPTTEGVEGSGKRRWRRRRTKRDQGGGLEELLIVIIHGSRETAFDTFASHRRVGL